MIQPSSFELSLQRNIKKLRYLRFMIQLAPILVCLWFWFIAPGMINAEPVVEEIDSQAETLVQPLETYHLSILEEGRREVAIDPPATNIVITSQSGDTVVRCGDTQNAYSCSPGKRLELKYDTATPVTKFWGENMSQTQVRLQIDVYQTVDRVSNN